MSYYDDASLVFIPSGYKTSKAYSIKPTDGSGDLAFSRSNDTATRVGPDGLIEKVRTNVCLYSEQLNNTGAWGFEELAVTANAVANPLDGAVTADKIYATVTGSSVPILKQTILSTANQIVTVSGYFKKAEYDYVVLHGFGLGGTTFNLADGTKSGAGSITSVGNGWYRCAAILDMGANTRIFITPSVNGSVGYTSTANSGVFAFGIQTEVSDFGATPYIATTSAAVSVGPVANVPRLDYLNSSCPRLLLEPQRTNVALYSEQFDNAAYSKVSGGSATTPIVTANFAISPDGYQNADRIQFARTGTTASDFSAINQSSLTLSATGTATIYLKSNTSSNQDVLMYWGSGQGQVFTVTPEWQRFTLTNLTAATDAIVIGTRGGSGSFFNGGSLTLDVLFYGLQVEAGAYATSYIPTLGAAVTRGADACSKTGISSLIGQTEGTIFLDFDFINSGVQVVFTIHDNSNSKRIEIWANNNSLQGFIGGSSNISVGASNVTNGRHKVALAYKQSGDHAYYIDGVQVGTSSTSYTIAALTSLIFEYWGSGFLEQKSVRQALLFKTRLSNADLAALTA